MKKIIDLHGLSHDKALIKVEDFLLANSFSNLLELELITGNSPLLQKKIINQILNKYQYTFYIPEYNRGMMYITDSKIK